MIWSRALVCLTAVISLSIGVIWPNAASAAVPAIVPLGSIEAGLSVPGKLDVDGSGSLYVADIGAKKVLKYDASGDFVRAFDAVAITGRGLAVNADGSRLYVAAPDDVVIIDGVTGDVVGQIALAGAGEIDLDGNGDVYVVDTAATQVKVYSAAGAFLRAIGAYGTANGQFHSIDSMSINTARNELYVAGMQSSASENGYATIQMFNLAGVYSGRIASVGGYISECGGMTFDAADREYYLDKLTGKIHVRPRGTGFSPVVFSISGSGSGQVIQPWDLVFDVVTSRLFASSDTGEIEIYGVDGGTTPEKNVAPGLPTLVSPIANSEAASLQPQLRFINATDLNGDSLTYDIEVSGSVALQYTVAGDVSGETVVQIDQDLAENFAYSWRVQARDSELESGWTAAQTFYVNANEEAPTAPVLTSALAGAPLAGVDALTWDASIDNDPLDSVQYLVEVSADDSFAEPVVSETFTATEVNLGDLTNYPELVPGSVYSWRVTAVDTHGLAAVSAETGSFRYETAMLSVTANLPDAKVFFAGNAAYSGQFVGTTPLELRDLAAGPYTVVVERAGCETFIAQIEVGTAGSVQVNANLLLAVAPKLKKASALRSVKTQLQSAEQVAPFVVDFDNDDMADLLVGDEAGAVDLFKALAVRGSKVQYAAAESLDFGNLPGTSLFVVDWNNDNKKDVLVGAADGTVSIYQQQAASSDNSPVFDPALFLRDGKGSVINVGSQANPAVIDFDNDGDKDLVVGTGNGKVLLYLNNGTDAAPALAIDPVTLVSFASGSVSPLFVDWDADGSRDLLISSAGSLLIFAPDAAGEYKLKDTLIDASANGIDAGARYFVVDADNAQGKDVYIGLVGGQVQIMRSAGKEFLPSVTAALLDKLTQVSDLAVADGVDVAATVEAVSVEISAGDFGAAARAAKALVAASPAVSDAATELIALLGQ